MRAVAPFDPKPVEGWPSVRLARVRAEIRQRADHVRTLDLEPLIHAELLAEMAAILSRDPDD